MEHVYGTDWRDMIEIILYPEWYDCFARESAHFGQAWDKFQKESEI